MRDGYIQTNKELGLEVGPGDGVKDMRASKVWGDGKVQKLGNR